MGYAYQWYRDNPGYSGAGGLQGLPATTSLRAVHTRRMGDLAAGAAPPLPTHRAAARQRRAIARSSSRQARGGNTVVADGSQWSWGSAGRCLRSRCHTAHHFPRTRDISPTCRAMPGRSRRKGDAERAAAHAVSVVTSRVRPPRRIVRQLMNTVQTAHSWLRPTCRRGFKTTLSEQPLIRKHRKRLHSR